MSVLVDTGLVVKNTISVGTRGSTLSGDGLSFSSTLRAAMVVTPGGEYGCYVTLVYACSVGAGELFCSVGAVLVV